MKYILTNQETERLHFRLLKKDYFEEWMPLFEAKNVGHFLQMKQGLSPREMCQIWFDRVLARYDNGRGGMNVLIDKETNRFVGQCGILVQAVEDVDRLEVGYAVLPEFWNKGYASEAAIKCRDYAFENQFSENLISMIHLENTSSEKVARRNGMTLEKTIDSFNIFSIQREDWLLKQSHKSTL